MKESLACAQCKNIICADKCEGERVIGNVMDREWVVFPENVEDCPRRVVPKPEVYLSDQKI